MKTDKYISTVNNSQFNSNLPKIIKTLTYIDHEPSTKDFDSKRTRDYLQCFYLEKRKMLTYNNIEKLTLNKRVSGQ